MHASYHYHGLGNMIIRRYHWQWQGAAVKRQDERTVRGAVKMLYEEIWDR
jgi:hypothetical protein